jgi:DNA-directed RNA polymerase subunit RPC12/RpoP
MAPLIFDGKTQKMVCEYCGSSYTMEELKAMEANADPDGRAADVGSGAKVSSENISQDENNDEWDPSAWQTGDMKGMKVLGCPSCGAEVIVEETVGAVRCPYCDNAMIVPKEFSGMYQPDYVIPFQKTKEEAVEALKKLYLKRPLLPKVFKDENHMEEIQAVYVPFWLFDLEASGDFAYEGIRRRFYEDKNYRYEEQNFYDVRRSGDMKFLKIPVDGSEKIDDTMMESIEPYRYEDLKPFELSYLSGYMANKYDVEADALKSRIEERMKKSVKHYFTDSAEGYDTLRPLKENITITKRGKVKYGLFPVWFLTTAWNGKRYAFAMNGQTGKMVGNLPIGKELVLRYWLERHIPLTLAMTLVLVILRLTGVI